MLGRTISHYRIIARLGQGGMGVVYRAEDTQLHVHRALKFLSAQAIEDPANRARLVREAQAAAALEHQNICPVHEIGDAEGQTFIVMSYLEGRTLADHLAAEGPLPVAEVLELASQIASGLQKAHGQGILHRDIKPANVMITPEGQAVIMDFGLSKSLEGTDLTRTHTILGTAHYMAPEQTRGDAVDQRADVWALGATIYEMLAGRRPFEAEHLPGIVYAIANEEPPALAGLRDDVPVDLQSVVERALAKEPQERYRDAGELLADLQALRSGDVVAPYKSQRRPLARPRAAGAAGSRRLRQLIVVTAAVAAGVVAWQLWLHHEGGTSSGPPPEPTLPARVLVAALMNRTGEADLDVVGQQAADLIAQGLAGLDAVEVVPAATVAATAANSGSAAGPDILNLARQQDARLAVHGVYDLNGDELSLQARITDAADGRLVIALPAISAPRGDPAAGLDEVCQRIMGGLAMHLDDTYRQPLPKVPPRYDAYREFMAAIGDPFDFRKCVAHVQQASALDSTFLRAQLFQTMMLSSRGFAADSLFVPWERKRERLTPYEQLFLDLAWAEHANNYEEALRFARLLVQQAPRDFYANERLIYCAWYVNRAQEAVSTYESMTIPLAIYQNEVCEWMLRKVGDAYHALGEYESELAHVREIKKRYPAFLRIWGEEARALAALGRLDELNGLVDQIFAMPTHKGDYAYALMSAIQALRAHGHRDESLALSNRVIAWHEERQDGWQDDPQLRVNMIMLLYQAERWEEARQALDLTVEAEGGQEGPWTHGFHGALAARRGDREEALRRCQIIRDWDYETPAPYMNAVGRAGILALLGEKEQAVKVLREGFAEMGLYYAPRLRLEMDLESLQGYPPFEELLRPKV